MKKKILIITLITGAMAWTQSTTTPTAPQPQAPTTNTTSSTTSDLNTPPATPNQKTLPVAPAANPETDLNARVKRDLLNDPAFSSIAPGITVENLNGQLTLRGQVPSREVEMNLINRASQSSGIFSINNQLTIVPSSATQSR